MEFFGELSESRLAQLQSSLQLRPFGRRDYLYFESEPAEHLWLVCAGQVRTLKMSSGGRVITIERLQPGELFGMAAVLEDSKYTESAQAIVPGEAWRASRRVVLALADEEPELARRLVGIVARRLQAAHDRLCSFAHDSVPARLARAVLDEGNGGRIEMTRRVLAESVGTTVETTIRVIRGFEREGWIEGGVGWLRVLDPGALQNIARGEPPPS